ncbi:hypothetical protein Prudu_004654 [Prunus dulcis]|uniref:Uncharacterized protein n=1 Tax=Prunus dulcis TaxID=3755 RepID=A0A4Y1QVU8_PRUDU|nr:hypothetical protein Prudu_004654 [Prunus dulcis]
MSSVDDGWGAFTITSITAVNSCCAFKEKRSFILFNTKFSYGMIQFVPDGRIAACSFGVLSYEP